MFWFPLTPSAFNTAWRIVGIREVCRTKKAVWGPSPQGKDPEVSEDTVSQLEGHPSPGRPP